MTKSEAKPGPELRARPSVGSGQMPGVTALCAALCLIASMTTGSACASTGDRDHSAGPVMSVQTSLGVIEIELFEKAAPGAVTRLMALADSSGSEPGYFDGLAFDYTKPRLEIRTQTHPSLAAELPVEIDATALGLDAPAARNRGEAMDILQDKLLAAFRKDKRRQQWSAQMRQWLNAWYETRDAGFLIGVSHRQINEALGYVYTDGLPSRPVTAGSVTLIPAGPTVATARLSVALRDLPQRDGRWMVIGRVVGGLDIAEAISLAPLEQPRDIKPRRYAPRDPVTIDSVFLAPPTDR